MIRGTHQMHRNEKIGAKDTFELLHAATNRKSVTCHGQAREFPGKTWMFSSRIF